MFSTCFASKSQSSGYTGVFSSTCPFVGFLPVESEKLAVVKMHFKKLLFAVWEV